MQIDQNRAQQVLSALGDQLDAAGERFEIVVIGGSALLALGLIDRATRDVDLVALIEDCGLVDPKPLPEGLIAARDRIARDFGLDADWLNAAPSSLLDFGLPDGFVGLETRHYGPSLTVHLASRFDQIHFKLYAMADGTAGKHEADLRALNPLRDELLLAARWTRTHDPSDAFRDELLAALAALGVDDATSTV